MVSPYHKPKAIRLVRSRAGIRTPVSPNPKTNDLQLIFKFKDQASVYISIHVCEATCSAIIRPWMKRCLFRSLMPCILLHISIVASGTRSGEQ